MKDTSKFYTEEYFTTINYTGYLSRYERYKKLSVEISELFTKISLLKKDSKILDYGCAVGFLPRAFDELGYKNCYGYDISEWARNQAKKHNVKILDNLKNTKFDVTFCLDVIEHMYDSQIDDWLKNFDTDCLVLRVPVAVKEGETYHLEVSRQDPTHINCKTKEAWKELLKKYGFTNFVNLNLLTIYDTDGVWSVICLKD